jgi:uncharacterized protein
LFISLQELETQNVRFKADIPAGEIEFDSKLKQATALHTEGVASLLSHSVGDVRVQGDLDVHIDAVCDRCLEAVKFPIRRHFDLVYLPASEAVEGGEEEIEGAGVDVGFYEGHGLELNDVLREVVLLDLPMQVVCDEACKGICPLCGQNRNQRDCNCRTKAEDDRWNKLKSLRAEMAREGIRK